MQGIKKRPAAVCGHLRPDKRQQVSTEKYGLHRPEDFHAVVDDNGKKGKLNYLNTLEYRKAGVDGTYYDAVKDLR